MVTLGKILSISKMLTKKIEKKKMTILNLCHHFGNGFEIKPEIFGYIDVGEGFWKRIMLVTDPLCFYISLGHQHSIDVTNIESQSPTSTNR